MERPQTNKTTSLLVGGTGLVGRSVLDSLINKDQTIVLLTRRRIQQLPSNVQQHVIHFDSLANDTVLPYSNHVYICLGSTMKQAGNKAHFKMVDLDYVVSVAKLALKSGASRLSIISSVGANPKSIFFYTKIKGLMELEILKLKYEQINFFRPSFIIGDRYTKRRLESFWILLFKYLNPMIIGRMKKYRSIFAKTVAEAMVLQTIYGESGLNYLYYNEIQHAIHRYSLFDRYK